MRMTYREAKERFDNHHETVQFSDSESDEFYLREIQRIEDWLPMASTKANSRGKIKSRSSTGGRSSTCRRRSTCRRGSPSRTSSPCQTTGRTPVQTWTALTRAGWRSRTPRTGHPEKGNRRKPKFAERNRPRESSKFSRWGFIFAAIYSEGQTLCDFWPTRCRWKAIILTSLHYLYHWMPNEVHCTFIHKFISYSPSSHHYIYSLFILLILRLLWNPVKGVLGNVWGDEERHLYAK